MAISAHNPAFTPGLDSGIRRIVRWLKWIGLFVFM
jgi:hypothetical protein